MPSPVDPTARDKYLLEVTAGPSYDASTHTQIPVNDPSPTLISSALLTAHLHVRIKDYHGLPPTSPSTSPYFQHDLHTSDRYSIAYSFIPKRNIPGANLVMGFDYDHSIKHQLPPGTKTALKIATSLLDPGLYSDPYCDEPYLYGPALSSWFAFSIGDAAADVPAATPHARLAAHNDNNNDAGGIVTEGAFGTGATLRAAAHIPPTWKKRRKHFLAPEARSAFVFERDRLYRADFFNPHLDFANFALRLPGFSISVARYVDERTHQLRYVVKDRESGEVGLVVFFKLLFGSELEERRREMQGLGEEEEGDEGVGGVEERTVAEVNGGVQELGSAETKTGLGGCEREKDQHHMPEDTGTHSTRPPVDAREGGEEEEEQEQEEEEGGVIATASSAASTLATSIYSVYAALGFATSSSSSSSSSSIASPDSHDQKSTQSSNRLADAEIDKLDDATVERYLQARHSNVE